MGLNKRCLPGLTAFVVTAALISGGCNAKAPNTGTEDPSVKQWQVIGPGGGGGIFLPTISPFDPKIIMTHCDMTAAYITYDGGENWRMLNLWTVPTDFEFDPVDPNTIYAANRGSLHDEDRGSGLGLLYRSEDQGKRWRVIYPDISKAKPVEKLQSQDLLPSQIIEGALDGTIQKICVDPQDNRKIYLGLAPLVTYMSGGRNQERKPAMLVCSADRGETWRLVTELPGSSVREIFAGSLDGKPGEVTVFTEQACARVKVSSGEVTQLPLPVERIMDVKGGATEKGSIFYVLSPMRSEGGKATGGVYRSSDRGETWEQVNSGLLEGVPAGSVPRFRSMAAGEKNPEVAYISCTNSRTVSREDTTIWRYAIFKTENAGGNWRPVLLSSSRSYLTNNFEGSWMEQSYGPGWGGNPIHMGIAPGNPDICFASDNGRCYRTLDGGKTWQQDYSRNLPDGSFANIGLNVTTCYGIHFDPFDRNHFFITYTDIGLFHTFSGGKSWVHSLDGVPRPWHNTCYWLEFDPQVKGRLWSVWANAHDLPRTKMFGRQGFGRYQGGVAVSEDGGRTWNKSNRGIPENSIGTHVLVDPLSPENSRILYACMYDRGVYKSTDGGQNWKEANQGLGDNRLAWQMRRNSEGRLFLLLSRGLTTERETVDGELYFSDDKAVTWQPLGLPEGVNAPHDLQVDPDEPLRMYLSCWARTVDGKDKFGGVFRTGDGGKSWKQVFDERIRVNSGALDPNRSATIFINTFHNAAYRSDDRGETWKRLEGYRFKWGQRAIPDINNPGMLFLTTYGGSVFYGPADGVPGAFEDIENLPSAWW
jgi:photosystem II stability/assembly factor-like uncharacterized protein